MTKQPTFKTERIDDIPLLLAQLERMQVGSLLDEHFPTHGNWQGRARARSVPYGWPLSCRKATTA